MIGKANCGAVGGTPINGVIPRFPWLHPARSHVCAAVASQCRFVHSPGFFSSRNCTVFLSPCILHFGLCSCVKMVVFCYLCTFLSSVCTLKCYFSLHLSYLYVRYLSKNSRRCLRPSTCVLDDVSGDNTPKHRATYLNFKLHGLAYYH
jgi:hypothetical protein